MASVFACVSVSLLKCVHWQITIYLQRIFCVVFFKIVFIRLNLCNLYDIRIKTLLTLSAFHFDGDKKIYLFLYNCSQPKIFLVFIKKKCISQKNAFYKKKYVLQKKMHIIFQWITQFTTNLKGQWTLWKFSWLRLSYLHVHNVEENKMINYMNTLAAIHFLKLFN